MTKKLKLAGELIPANVAEAFRNAVPHRTDGGAWAFHNGILAAGQIGALRKRGFLTGGYGPVTIDGQQRTISMLTEKGRQALCELVDQEPIAILTDGKVVL